MQILKKSVFFNFSSINFGGNKGAGDLGENLSFIEFANAFGVTDVLSLSGTQDGVSDIYIV